MTSLDFAFTDWLSNDAYWSVDRRGRKCFRLKSKKSRIAPWSKLAIERFGGDLEAFRRAAHAWAKR